MACGTFQISLPCTNHEINPSKKWRYHHLLRNWWAPNVPCRKQWRLLSKLPAMQSGLGRIKPSAKLKQIPTATKVSTQNCRVSFFDNVVVLWLQKPHNGEYTYLRTKRSPMSRVYTQPLRKQRDGDGTENCVLYIVDRSTDRTPDNFFWPQSSISLRLTLVASAVYLVNISSISCEEEKFIRDPAAISQDSN